jgi:hypothetical protein
VGLWDAAPAAPAAPIAGAQPESIRIRLQLPPVALIEAKPREDRVDLGQQTDLLTFFTHTKTDKPFKICQITKYQSSTEHQSHPAWLRTDGEMKKR